MKPDLMHVVFGSVRSLPPLMHELSSLANEQSSVQVIDVHTGAEPFLRDSSLIEFESLSLIFRKISTSQLPLFKLLRYIEFCIRLFMLIVKNKPRIVIAHDLIALLPAYFPSRLISARVIYNAHELWTERQDASTPMLRLWRRLDRFFCKRVDRIIAPESNRANIYLHEYGASEMPIVVRNIPPRHATPEASIEWEGLLHRSLPRNYAIVLYQGLIHESRCLSEVIHAMAKTDRFAVLVLIGSGEEAYRRSLHESIRQLVLEDRVFILAPVSSAQLRPITASAAIGILLYKNDGRNNYFCAPNKLYEYMQAGLPMIASDFPGLSEVIEKNEIGVCVDPSNVSSITNAIDRLLQETSERVEMKRRALELAESSYTWESEFKKLRSLYNELNVLQNRESKASGQTQEKNR